MFLLAENKWSSGGLGLGRFFPWSLWSTPPLPDFLELRDVFISSDEVIGIPWTVYECLQGISPLCYMYAYMYILF